MKADEADVNVNAMPAKSRGKRARAESIAPSARPAKQARRASTAVRCVSGALLIVARLLSDLLRCSRTNRRRVKNEAMSDDDDDEAEAPVVDTKQRRPPNAEGEVDSDSDYAA